MKIGQLPGHNPRGQGVNGEMGKRGKGELKKGCREKPKGRKRECFFRLLDSQTPRLLDFFSPIRNRVGPCPIP